MNVVMMRTLVIASIGGGESTLSKAMISMRKKPRDGIMQSTRVKQTVLAMSGSIDFDVSRSTV